MAAPTSRLAVAFLHDPCTVSTIVSQILYFQLGNPSWGFSRPAGANCFLLKSVPGMAAPTSRLAVAFLHDPCIVSTTISQTPEVLSQAADTSIEK